MNHQITIIIESEKEWSAVCALSSLLEKPLSEVAKNDLLSMTKQTAANIKKDRDLFKNVTERNPDLMKKLLAVLN